MKVTIAQLNPVVGDLDGNLQKMEQVMAAYPSDLVIFSELYLTGNPLRDLLESRSFLSQTKEAVQGLCQLSAKHPRMGIICGLPTLSPGKKGKVLRNSAILVTAGKVIFQQDKALLSTYDVYDEARYFKPADQIKVIDFKEEKLGIVIGEVWSDPHDSLNQGQDQGNPVRTLAEAGATLLINISASPYHLGREELRFQAVSGLVKEYGIPFVYVNQVGANDELIFDGRSMVLDKAGRLVWLAPAFQEYTGVLNPVQFNPEVRYEPGDEVESIYQALVLGIRDYMGKTGFSRAVIGLSGGIDSALVLCLAVEAVGRENVLGIALPSPYSPKESVEDARKLADNLGIEFKIIPISELFRTYLRTLEKDFSGRERDSTEENLQARIRGDILMAFSNKFGYLLLSTGNKSEIAVGYCTLYGDMSGALSVLADVPKTMVYKLAEFINEEEEIIPREIIEKAPSAELRPGQKDEDSLPPYSVLDRILQLYIEEGLSAQDLLAQGFEKNTVQWVIKTLAQNEYKRKQAAPGLKITPKAFGTGRRMPIVAKFDLRID